MTLIYNATFWLSVANVIAGVVWATASVYATEALRRWTVNRPPSRRSVVAAGADPGDD